MHCGDVVRVELVDCARKVMQRQCGLQREALLHVKGESGNVVVRWTVGV